MLRLYSLGSWFCTSLALTLAVVAALAVPEGAFADSGLPPPPPPCTNCSGDCSYQCGSDNTCYENCMTDCTGPCCNGQCGSDPDCYYSCCQAACGDDQTCQANCQAGWAGPGCTGGTTCYTPGNKCNPTDYPNCSNMHDQCAATPPPGNDCSGCICKGNKVGGFCGCYLP
jgi:hypothetical protein